MKRAALYLRVSSDRQAREGDSIPAQRDALHKYAQEHNFIVCGEYLDDGISGTKYSQRDELQRLLDDVEHDKVDVILFTKLDRWFRSVRHYTATQEILDRHGVGWTAIWEPIYDTTTPSGRLIVNQMMSIAQFEAENTGQRIRQVFAYKVQQHEVVTGSTPPGYRIENKHLVPSESESKAVLTAFETFARTSSLNATTRACAAFSGLPRTHSGIKRVLRNRVYIGEWHGVEGFCEPIVPAALFEDVQRKLSMNVKSSQKRTYIFSGLLRCRECGCVLGANTRRRKRGSGKTETIIQYRCAKHFNHKPALCTNPKVINEGVLERDLMEQLRPMIENEVLDYEVRTAPHLDRSEQVRNIERKLSRLKELYVNELITLEEYRADKDDYEAQIRLLQAAEQPQERDINALRALLKTDIEDLYWEMNPAEKRRFWRAIIDVIVWGDDRSIEVKFL